MLLYQIILGAVQGLSEFLPISSSGHLLLVSRILQVELPLVLEILLHIATLGAVCVFTFPILAKIISALGRFFIFHKNFNAQNEISKQEDLEYLSLVIKLILTTLSTIPIALLLRNFVITLPSNYIAYGLLFSAFILIIPFLNPSKRRQIRDHSHYHNNSSVHLIPNITFLHAILLGLVQGIAVLPGISRSGITISICVLLGYNYLHAARYSFLMSIPAILASFVFSFSDLGTLFESTNIPILVLSLLTAFLFGLIGLKGLSIIAHKGKIWIFSIYLVIIATVILFL